MSNINIKGEINMKDYEIVTLADEKAVEEYLCDRLTTDVWYTSVISGMKIITSPKLIIDPDDNSVNIAALNNFISKNNIIGDKSATLECILDTNLFLKLKIKNKWTTLPIRRTALRSIMARAKVSGLSIQTEEPGYKSRHLPVERRAEILTEMLGLYDMDCKILYRDEKVNAVLSDQYAILEENALYASLKSVLNEKFPLNKLEKGSVSHEHFELMYSLEDEDVEEDIEIKLQEANIPFSEVKIALKFLTSDIGQANASVYPYIVIDDTYIRLGNPVNIKHFGKNTVKDFEKAIENLYAVFEKSMFDFEKLSNQKIMYPAGCLRSIAYTKGLPKKSTMKVAEELDLKFPLECSGFDILMALNRIGAVYSSDNKDADFVRLLNIQENIAEAMTCNFEKYDKDFEWLRGENID